VPLAVVPVRAASASAFVAEITPADDVAATPETEAVTLAKTVPTEEGSDHDPSDIPDACVAVTVPSAEVTDCPARATVIVMLAEPDEMEAVAMASGFVDDIDPAALVAENPESASVFDSVIVPTADVAERPAIVSALDAAIVPGKNVPVRPAKT
jgi:hypothetical protein